MEEEAAATASCGEDPCGNFSHPCEASEDPECDWNQPTPDYDACTAGDESLAFGSCINDMYMDPPQELQACWDAAYPADDD